MWKRLCALAGGAVAFALAQPPASAETLALPAAAAHFESQIADDCPGCAERGFLPCGAPDVQYGRRFARAAMQGAPPRAYLLANAPTARELRPLLTGADAPTVAREIAERFREIRLILIEDAWTTARVLTPVDAGRMRVDAAQQACFRDPKRSRACCLGDGPRDMGCLPKADPPTMTLVFQDDATRERLSLRYPVGRGEATLRRATASGGKAIYWCHKWARARIASN